MARGGTLLHQIFTSFTFTQLYQLCKFVCVYYIFVSTVFSCMLICSITKGNIWIHNFWRGPQTVLRWNVESPCWIRRTSKFNNRKIPIHLNKKFVFIMSVEADTSFSPTDSHAWVGRILVTHNAVLYDSTTQYGQSYCHWVESTPLWLKVLN